MAKIVWLFGMLLLTFMAFGDGAKAHMVVVGPIPLLVETPTSTPTAIISPEQQAAMVNALGPLPTFGPFGKGQFPLQHVEVQTQHLLAFTLEGQDVLLWTYLIRPFYGDTGDGSSDATIRGELGMALFTPQSQLLWRKKLADLEYISQLHIDVTPILFTTAETGLFYEWRITYEGSGALTIQHSTIYRWLNHAYGVIWQNDTAQSQAMGVGYHRSRGEQIAIRNVDYVAIDTDLQADFIDRVLSTDDLLFDIVLDPIQSPPVANITVVYANNAISVTVAAAPMTNDSAYYSVELAIPLTSLDLVGSSKVGTSGWVGRRPSDYSPQGTRLYYPSAGRIIGLAVDRRDGAAVQWDDPTTWPTLIMIAERR